MGPLKSPDSSRLLTQNMHRHAHFSTQSSILLTGIMNQHTEKQGCMLACFYSKNGNHDNVSQCVLTTALNCRGSGRDNSDSRWAFPPLRAQVVKSRDAFPKTPSNPINFRQRLGCRFAHSRSRRWLTHSDDDHNDDDGDADDGGDDGADYDDDADDDDYGGDDKDGVDDGEDGGDECVDDDGAADDHEVLI